MGSKARHAKHLLPIILKDRKPGQWYVEPFVGGANMIDKVDGNRIGSDTNKYIIATLKALSAGWLPPRLISKEDYETIKNDIENYPDELVGYVGFQLTFSSQWFGSYRRDNEGKRNYSVEAYKNVSKQAPNLNGIDFYNCSYDELYIPEKSIVYCDPPYLGTSGYGENTVDHDKFWGWCDNLVDKGHQVFVSEYQAPEHWECVWSKEVNSSLTKNTGAKKAVEKLFTRIKASTNVMQR